MEWSEKRNDDASVATLEAVELIADGVVADITIDAQKQTVTLNAPNGTQQVKSIGQLDQALAAGGVIALTSKHRGDVELILDGFQN